MNEAKTLHWRRHPRFSPFFIPMMITDIAPGRISIRDNLRGPNYATVSACASSTHAPRRLQHDSLGKPMSS